MTSEKCKISYSFWILLSENSILIIKRFHLVAEMPIFSLLSWCTVSREFFLMRDFPHVFPQARKWKQKLKKKKEGVHVVVQQKRIRLGTMRLQVLSLDFAQWVKRIRGCRELWCRSQMQLRSYIEVAMVQAERCHVENILTFRNYTNILQYHKIYTYSFNCLRSINVHSE